MNLRRAACRDASRVKGIGARFGFSNNQINCLVLGFVRACRCVCAQARGANSGAVEMWMFQSSDAEAVCCLTASY